MSEFFNKTNEPDYWETAANQHVNRAKTARREVMVHAGELHRAAQELAGRLTDRGVPPNITVVATEVEKAGRARTAWRKQFRWQEDPHHYPVGAQVLGRGWLISQTSVRSGKANSRSITLLEDGSLVISGPTTGEGSARQAEAYREPAPGLESVPGKTILGRNKNIHGTEKRKWQEAPRGAVRAAIDLTTFPTHPLFATEKSYANTTLGMPDLGANPDSAVDPHTPEAYVAANLERLEHDLRSTGRELLGYDRP
ncbi:MAG TPA: hypothetical protein VN778_04880 [Verrucomicrobiae bacterium]|nr:hypothetical protein [Verrucomicrobiae bacterium]